MTIWKRTMRTAKRAILGMQTSRRLGCTCVPMDTTPSLFLLVSSLPSLSSSASALSSSLPAILSSLSSPSPLTSLLYSSSSSSSYLLLCLGHLFFFAGFLQTCLVLVRNRQRHQDLKHPSCSYCNRQFHSLKALNRHRYSRINGICAKATPGFTGTVAEPSVMAYLNTSEGMLHATVNLVESESAATSPTKGSVSSASYGTGRGGGGGGGGGGYGNTTRVLGGGRAASSKYSFSSTNRSHVSKHNTTKRAATSPAKGGYTSYLANSPQRTSTPPRSRGSRIPADQGSGALDDLAFDASHVAHDHGHGHDESHRQHDMTHMQPHSHSHIHRSYGSNKAKLSSTVSGWQTSKSPTKGGGRPGARTRTRDGGVANRTFVPASEATQMSVSFRSEVDVSRWVI